MQGSSTRQDFVVKFLTRLRKFVKYPSETTLHIVIDNHRAHYTNAVKQACVHLNIRLHFMPSYSPEFNSIEALWGKVKQNIKHRLALNKYTLLGQEEFQKMLAEVLSTVTYDIQANAAKLNNRAFLHRILGECIQREDFPHLFVDQRQ